MLFIRIVYVLYRNWQKKVYDTSSWRRSEAYLGSKALPWANKSKAPPKIGLFFNIYLIVKTKKKSPAFFRISLSPKDTFSARLPLCVSALAICPTLATLVTPLAMCIKSKIPLFDKYCVKSMDGKPISETHYQTKLQVVVINLESFSRNYFNYIRK